MKGQHQLIIGVTLLSATILSIGLFTVFNTKTGTTSNNNTVTNNTTGQCTTCDQPSSWGDCINGQQNRTNYRCGASTNYQCQPYVESLQCANNTFAYASL